MNGTNPISPLNIEKYCDHYLEKFSRSNNSTPLSLEDFENFKYLISTLNDFSLENLTQYSKSSYSFLKKANKLSKTLWRRAKILTEDMEIIKNAALLRSLTLNSLGCYFMACNKLSIALEFLEKATLIEKKGSVDDYQIATTLLNLTTVLSKLGNHNLALYNSLQATRILEKVDEEREITETLSKSYYTHAVELEYLCRSVEAHVFFEKAYELCKSKLGESHQFSQNYSEKLAEFNAAHTSDEITPQSLPDTNNKTQSSFARSQKEGKALDILHTAYKVFGNTRYKIFILNKKEIAAFKVLAFPKNKHPVYRMICNYIQIADICENEKCNNLEQSTQEDAQECAKQLIEFVVIEKGGLKVIRV